MAHYRNNPAQPAQAAQPTEVIQQAARITHQLADGTSEITIYESDSHLYLYETVRSSQPLTNAPTAEKPAPLHRRVTLYKAEELWDTLRCIPGQEAMVLAQDLEGSSTLSDLLELLLAANCPYVLDNSPMSKAF